MYSPFANDLLCARLLRIHSNSPWQIKAHRSAEGILGVVQRTEKVRGGRTWRQCPSQRVSAAHVWRWRVSFACWAAWGQHCLTPSRRWKELCAAQSSSFHRKVGHDTICLQKVLDFYFYWLLQMFSLGNPCLRCFWVQTKCFCFI